MTNEEQKQEPRPSQAAAKVNYERCAWGCDTCEDSGTVEKCESPGEHANRSQEPCPDCKPEPRPSSALLEAAKLAAEWLEIIDPTGGGEPAYQFRKRTGFIKGGDTEPQLARMLRQAIKAEEARGPSEVETLREDRDDAPLRWLLCQYGDPYDEPSDTERDAAIAELCRRALGGK